MTDKNYAAIDLGSNSCRLLICNQKGEQLFADNFSTRLAEGMGNSGCLTAQAIARGEEAFVKIRELLDKYNVQDGNLRAITTAACRMAENGQEFIEDINKISHIKLEIIDGKEEAELNLQGASEHVKGKTPYLVIWDIGGGSTEITLAYNNEKPQIIKTISIPYGARNGAETFEMSVYDVKKADKLCKEVDGYLDEFLSNIKMPEAKDISFVATSSTALRTVAMIEGKTTYNREAEDGHIITKKALDDLVGKLYRQTVVEMAHNPCIGETRAPIFIAAVVIFMRIVARLDADNITASLKSAKDAIITNLIERDKKHG